jgi:hypothetical protein
MVKVVQAVKEIEQEMLAPAKMDIMKMEFRPYAHHVRLIVRPAKCMKNVIHAEGIDKELIVYVLMAHMMMV